MKRTIQYIGLLSGLGGCWTLISNLYGVADKITSKWPAIGDLLPIIGIASTIGIGIAFALIVLVDLCRAFRARKRNIELLEKRKALNNLLELTNLIGGLDFDGAANVRIHVVLNKLIDDGIADYRAKELGENTHRYIVYLTELVRQYGVEFVRQGRPVLIKSFLKEE